MVRSVLIAGATVEGLCLAHGLRKRGVPVTVYERGDGFGPRGPRMLLRIDKRALAGLAACLPAEVYDRCVGLCDSLDPVAHTHFDSQLREVRGNPAVQLAAPPAGTVVDQEALRRTLFVGVADSVRFGKPVTGYREEPGGIRVHLSGGAEVRGDALVLADGMHSAARDALIPEFELLDTGLDGIHGHVPFERDLFDRLPEDVLVQDRPILGPGRCAMVVRAYLPRALAHPEHPGVGELTGLRGYVKWTAVLPSRPGVAGAAPAVLRRIVMERTARWHPAVRMLLERTEDHGLFAAPVRASAPLRQRRPGKVTALGAAARVLPSVGVLADGAALHDAGRLAAAIHQDHTFGIASHDKQMLDEGNAAVGQALDELERTFHL